MLQKKPPKILYLSDVPVELSHGGATLIYRLLEFYPKDRITIVQTCEVTKKRIEGIPYHLYQNQIIRRLSKTRFGKVARELQLASSFLKIPIFITRIIKVFKPDIILTVTFGTFWIIANNAAKKWKLPMHLILHDELLLTDKYLLLDSLFRNTFQLAYINASSRMCISQSMENYYFKKYAVNGNVLPPTRGKYDNVIEPKTSTQIHGLHYCYAGSVHTGDFLPMLDKFAAAIENRNGSLSIFSEVENSMLEKYPNLLKAHVNINKLVSPIELKKFMLKSVDVNLLLNSFWFEEIFKYNFSSKVVDYSSVSLPILFWGPVTSGVISWSIEMDYPLIISENTVNAVLEMLDKIENPTTLDTAINIIYRGFNEYFSYERNFNNFIEYIY